MAQRIATIGTAWLLVLLAGLWAVGALAAESPRSIAGFALGQNVEEAAGRVDRATALPVWREEYLKRVMVLPQPGFRSGSLTYGDCKAPGSIVRIKLSYEDEGLGFFNKLLKELERRYGRGQWRGDAFGTLRDWKWSFTDASGDAVSLSLQHYSGKDPGYTRGASVRLANRSAMDRERDCGLARQKAGAAPTAPPAVDIDLEQLLPR